jgi:hypothetical protein
LEKGLSTGDRSTCPLIGKERDLAANPESNRFARGDFDAAKFSHRENVRIAKERRPVAKPRNIIAWQTIMSFTASR